jgi:integrase
LSTLEAPYLWGAKGRQRRLYWFYRRNGQRIPITSPDGRRLQKGDDGFLEVYERIHASFGKDDPKAPSTTTGSLAHLIDVYRSAPEFRTLKPRTQRDYGRYLDLLKQKHGHRSVALLPREAVLTLRDEYQATPRTANYIIQVLRLILAYAEDRKITFRLGTAWSNPARRPKKLRTGEGYRPWEEVEIDAFRKRWPIGTLVRVLFETFLNSGQRGGDIAPMVRQQYYKGEISVAQKKAGERVWIPAAADLRAALDPWLAGHNHIVMFPTETERRLKEDHMRKLMRLAIRDAALPDTCHLHGLRYSFATRAIEIGLDWQTIESIVGHKTAEMAQKYTAKRRQARLAIVSLDQARKANRESAK